MLCPNPSSQCGLMRLSQWEKQRRANIKRHKTQLCTLIGDCRHLKKGNCKFAHALEDLRPTPAIWNTTKGLYWDQGKPLPKRQVVDLIERYAELSSLPQLPQWVHDLRAEMRDHPPWKRHHSK